MASGAPVSRRALIGAASLGLGALTLSPGLARAAVSGQPPVKPGGVTLLAPGKREVAISEWVPQGPVRGTILFSHGAGSAPWYYAPFVDPWVAAGYRVLAPLHVDSREHPHTKDYPGLASWKTRIEDMRLLIDHIGDTPFIAAGHSYGGLTALLLGGAQGVAPEGIDLPFVPRLATAVVAFSPPAPVPVLMTEEGYGKLAVPALIQTGTLDIVPGITTEDPEGWKGHLVPFHAAAEGGSRYGLVLEGANHYFGGAICDLGQPGPLQLAQCDLASRYAGLFIEGHGLGNGDAVAALDARVTQALPARLMAR